MLNFMVKNVSLHHGSILFDTDLEALVRSLNVDDEKIISKGIRSVKERVTNVIDYLPNKISSEEFRDKMLECLTKDMDIYSLTQVDIDRINEIKKEQFDKWDWNMGKSPKFNRTKEKRLEGGKLKVCSFVEKGIIKDIRFYGDFFALKDVTELANAIINTKYDENSIEMKLVEQKADEYFFKITIQEVKNLII